MLFLALAGPFCVLGNLGKPEIRIEQRAEGVGFEGYWGPSSVKWTVVQQRGGDVDDYLRWVLGQQQSNAALSPGGLNYGLGGLGVALNHPLVKHESP